MRRARIRRASIALSSGLMAACLGCLALGLGASCGPAGSTASAHPPADGGDATTTDAAGTDAEAAAAASISGVVQ
jgi:hypothetical protein